MFISNETFSVWDYSVGHQQLLLRSSSDSNGKNVNTDIVFIGVFYLQIPTLFEGIQIQLANLDDIYTKIAFQKTIVGNEKYFCIIANEKKFFIGALNFSAFLNDLEFDVSSLSGIEFDMQTIA